MAAAQGHPLSLVPISCHASAVLLNKAKKGPNISWPYGHYKIYGGHNTFLRRNLKNVNDSCQSVKLLIYWSLQINPQKANNCDLRIERQPTCGFGEYRHLCHRFLFQLLSVTSSRPTTAVLAATFRHREDEKGRVWCRSSTSFFPWRQQLTHPSYYVQAFINLTINPPLSQFVGWTKSSPAHTSHECPGARPHIEPGFDLTGV